MSRSKGALISEILELEQPRVTHRDAKRVLNHLGFVCRTSHGTHIRWKHPETGTLFTHSQRKETDVLWGFQLNDFRRAVEAVVQAAKENIKTVEPTPIKLIENTPNNEKGETPTMAVATLTKPMKITCLTAKNFPDEVKELFLAFENKELTGRELCKLLTESGYRRAKGQAFTPSAVYCAVLNTKTYRNWKQNRLAEEVSETVVEEVPNQPDSLPTEAEGQTTPKTPQSVLERLQTLLKELDNLRTENKALKAELAQIQKLLGGGESRNDA